MRNQAGNATMISKNGSSESDGLLRDLLHGAEELILQQIGLLKSEVQEELHKAGGAALSYGAGAGLLAASGVLSTVMLVHLLHRATRLPLWTCYGIVAGAAGAAGIGLLARGQKLAADVQLPALPQTRAALKDNLTWLKEQMTPVNE
jgi:hypothetical protein